MPALWQHLGGIFVNNLKFEGKFVSIKLQKGHQPFPLLSSFPLHCHWRRMRMLDWEITEVIHWFSFFPLVFNSNYLQFLCLCCLVWWIAIVNRCKWCVFILNFFASCCCCCWFVCLFFYSKISSLWCFILVLCGLRDLFGGLEFEGEFLRCLFLVKFVFFFLFRIVMMGKSMHVLNLMRRVGIFCFVLILLFLLDSDEGWDLVFLILVACWNFSSVRFVCFVKWLVSDRSNWRS